MIIDNPSIYRKIVEKVKPYFTHQGAEKIFTQMKEDLDAYAARYGTYADRIWSDEYLRPPSITTRCASSRIGFQ